jgi:hypothetical protein
MKIVIEIDEEDWKDINDIHFIREDLKFKIGKTIMKGTPLPEHHGRLGDLDALEEYFRNVRKELKASDYKNGVEFFVRDEMLLNVQQFIHLCDAIIEGSNPE